MNKTVLGNIFSERGNNIKTVHFTDNFILSDKLTGLFVFCHTKEFLRAWASPFSCSVRFALSVILHWAVPESHVLIGQKSWSLTGFSCTWKGLETHCEDSEHCFLALTIPNSFLFNIAGYLRSCIPYNAIILLNYRYWASLHSHKLSQKYLEMGKRLVVCIKVSFIIVSTHTGQNLSW